MSAIRNVKRHAGIAGQFSVTAEVLYDDEPPMRVEFVGSSFGGPVVMILSGHQTFVTAPERFGAFGIDWVRAFYAGTL